MKFVVLAFCVLLATPVWGQSTNHSCVVFADDLDLAAELISRQSSATAEERRKVEVELGRFNPEISLEAATTRSFPLPSTDRVVTVTVVYVEGFVPRLAKYSMTVAVAVSNEAVSSAVDEPGSAIAQTDLEIDTFKVIAKQIVVVSGKKWLIGADCQLISDEERRKQLESVEN